MVAIDTQIKETLLTADEYMALPDDGRRTELIEGEVIEMPPSTVQTSVLAGWIGAIIVTFVVQNKLGFVSGVNGGYRVNEKNVPQPDVGFITTARAGGLSGVEFPVAPDLAVEVISPSERFGAINRKLRIYFNGGTRLVWLVYAEPRIVEVYTAVDQFTEIGEAGTIDGGEVLPGFSVTGSELFRVLNVEETTTKPEESA